MKRSITKAKIRAGNSNPLLDKNVTTGLIMRKPNMITENSGLNEMKNRNEITAEEASESKSMDCTIMEHAAKHKAITIGVWVKAAYFYGSHFRSVSPECNGTGLVLFVGTFQEWGREKPRPMFSTHQWHSHD
jgi:hypothetical protein